MFPRDRNGWDPDRDEKYMDDQAKRQFQYRLMRVEMASKGVSS